MIPGPSEFDLVIFLGCLLAMFFSQMPAKLAISVCLGVSLWGILINTARMHEFITVNILYSLCGIVEIVSAAGLILYARFIVNHRDRVFFLLMAMFLLLSSAINVILIPIYIYTDLLTFEAYQAAFHLIAVLHVMCMLGYSDGVRLGITNLRRVWVRDNAHYSNR